MRALPLVSVILLSYNRPEEIKRAVKAICAQTYGNLDILIGDDCSTDPEVGAVLSECRQTDSRIRVFVQPKNLGIISHQKFLLTQVPEQTQYIVWACDDDDWHPEYIAGCVQALEEHPEAVLCCANVLMQHKGNRFPMPTFEDSDTLGNGIPGSRFHQVVKNILWWNHAFYGVIRKEAYTLVPLRHAFCFDIYFVAELALHGQFIKLPNYYFTKSTQGIGSSVESNLAAISVNSRLAEKYPRLAVALGLMRLTLRSKQVGFMQKAWTCVTIARTARRTEMFPKDNED